MDEEIDRINRALSFTVEEEQGIVIPRELWPGNSTDHSLSLVGRIVTHRGFNFDALCSTFLHAANPGKGMEFTRISTDRFLLHFHHCVDKRRILEGGPWNFDNHLILLGAIGSGKEPLTMDLYFCDFSVWIHGLSFPQISSALGRIIGSKLGSVKHVFTGEDVRRLLLRRTIIKSTEGQETVVTFTYERLGNFCYLCGIIGHVDSICDLRYADDFVDPGINMPYGPWLHASSRGRSLTPPFGPSSASRPRSSLRGAHIFGGFRPPDTSTSQRAPSQRVHVPLGLTPSHQDSLPSENASLVPDTVPISVPRDSVQPLAGLVNVPLEFSAQSSPSSIPTATGSRTRGALRCRNNPVSRGCRGRKRKASSTKPFRFESWWLRVPGCEETVAQSWRVGSTTNLKSRLRQRLHGCESDLSMWSSPLKLSRKRKKELEEELILLTHARVGRVDHKRGKISLKRKPCWLQLIAANKAKIFSLVCYKAPKQVMGF
ncbi:hypothetical protein Salat_0635700 [Sesamum alatum]|uniref:Zinc knuckle CX2CX4HX4C domain-containing protein n=1 Tax=Sesamum alatum TaxID=300844 RepID=A0AAE1YQJ1_9LAMI|nr:hypothetical protein Salat_0635700 [Sesamum alatum]